MIVNPSWSRIVPRSIPLAGLQYGLTHLRPIGLTHIAMPHVGQSAGPEGPRAIVGGFGGASGPRKRLNMNLSAASVAKG